MPVIKTSLGERSYDILVGRGIAGQLQRRLTRRGKTGQLWTIWDAQFYVLHGQRLKKLAPSLRVGSRELVLPGGERIKTTGTLKAVHDFLLGQKVSRNDTIIALGGGALTDLAGYAAATVLRGIPWITIPTTLLGMVDAAIGGKTAINHKQGKNLIGAIWQPSLVVCDLEFLSTLPERQMVSGLGEIIKYCGLIGDNLIRPVSRLLTAGDLYNLDLLSRIVYKCAAYKAEIVEKDEREAGRRMLLNFGHTFGHGIERSLNYKKLSHGEAVTIGLLAAIEASVISGTASSRSLSAYQEIVCRAVRTIPKTKVDLNAAVAAMALDKKRISHNLRFVLLKRPGKPIITEKLKKSTIKAALKRALDVYSE